MVSQRLKYIVLGVCLAVGLTGLGIRQWVSAADEPAGLPPALDAPATNERVKPAVPPRRREAVIRLPAGTFVKEVEVAPYGSGRLTWTYEDDRVVGLIEASGLGAEIELATEAEISLSSNGTVYGLITGARVNHLRLPEGDGLFGALKLFWPAAEPLVTETLLDLPFSYQFRVHGDQLVISSYRILLAGPNPLGKVGGVMAGGGNNELFMMMAYFQGLGTAIEGTYTAADADRPAKRPLFLRPRGAGDTKKRR